MNSATGDHGDSSGSQERNGKNVQHTEDMDALLDHILRVLQSPSVPSEAELPESLRDCEKMQTTNHLLHEIRAMTGALSKGDLEYHCTAKGYVVGSLKAFQANLRHLTWQAQRIAEGEYNHRVDFFGDFSVAFNRMAEQLGSTIDNIQGITEEYKDLSHRDTLTGVYNRYAFFKFSEPLLAKYSRPSRPSTIVMADIDKFKKINDTHGHLCGDEVLKAFAACLNSALRAEDVCCRYGGEEFVVLMPDTPLSVGRRVVERLRRAAAEMRIPCEDVVVQISASFGLAEIDALNTSEPFADQLKAFLKKADEHLYEAKSTGRNRVCG